MLFADGDLFKLIFFLLFFAGPALFKMVFGDGQAANKPVGKPQQRPLPGQLPRQQAQKPADRLESEIEDFLRRAAGVKEEPIEAKVIEKDPQRPRQPQRSGRHQKPRVSNQIKRAPLRESVADHVDSHIKSNPVGRDSKRLGQSVADEIDRIEDHVHDVFDHTLGSLKETKPRVTNEKDDIDDRGTDSSVWEDVGAKQQRAADETAKRNTEILEMLRSPQNIRQAIIMAEVLKRPSFDE